MNFLSRRVVVLMAMCVLPATARGQVHFAFEDQPTESTVRRDLEATGAAVTCIRDGQWVPILHDGVQRKSIVPDSEQVLSEGERPVALQRGTDYEIDYPGGRFKALAGGRVELGEPCSLSFRYSRAGPTRAPGRIGNAIRFDGVDDYFDLPALPAEKRPAQFTLQLWIYLAEDCSDEAIILSDAPTWTLRLQGGRPQWTRAGSAPAAAKQPLDKHKWHHLAAVFDGATASLYVDGAKVAEQSVPGGAMHRLRLGGVRDPEFFAGKIDELKLHDHARSADDIANDAR